jgi:hypothetical protein
MELVKDELARSLIKRTSANLTNVRNVGGLVSKNPKETEEVGV